MSPTEILADFVARLSLRDLDQSTIKNARLAILDAIGCGIAGISDPAVHTLAKVLLQGQEGGAAPVFGRTDRFTPRAAALINGTMIHALEMDDTHSFSSVHVGGPVVSSALSASWAAQSTEVRRFIEAVVAGYEVACRLGMAIRGENPYRRGFHPTGICGVFGAATAAGKVLGLDARGFLFAWGIAGSMAGGLMAYLQNGAWTKKLQPGWAAQSGFLAASLARAEYVGPDDIFLGKFGFCTAYADQCDEKAFTDELGSRFEVNRMSYKRFACCRTIHSPITAALKLRTTPGFSPEEIQEIHALIADEDLNLVVEPLESKKHPATPVEAQFSMPFGVALALVRGDAMPEHYTEETLKDPLIQRVAEKFSYVVEDEFTSRRPLHFPCRLSVKVGGTWHSASVEAPLGDYTNPLSEAELMEKFHRLCDPVLGNERSDNLKKFLMFQEHENTLKEIGSLICVCGKDR